MFIIYKIVNPRGQVYIGQTKSTLSERFYQHVYDARHRAHGKLHESLNKYGPEAHKIKAIEEVPTENRAKIQEFRYILQYNTIKEGLNSYNGLNVTFGLSDLKIQYDKAMSW